MFTQKITMDCTKEQYEKYLKDELLKMGYKDRSVNSWNCGDYQYISNNYMDINGGLGTVHKDDLNKYERTYLGSFNAPLFLALAAMTDNPMGNYGEYVVGKLSGGFYRMIDKDCLHPTYNTIRKATKEEIMVKFGSNKELMWKSYSNTTKNLEEIYTAIELLKSKGYKILKPTNWEEV